MAGVDRGHAYYAQDTCADTLDVMNKRLSQDLRNRVRRIVHYPILSAEWREVAEIVQHLSQVASMEAKEVVKRDGSVWEREELCVRYVIEESKTNLLLRLMVEFKAAVAQMQMQDAASDAESTTLLKSFEAALGELLRCVFTAVEALQTLDVSLLLDHAETVLNAAVAHDGACDAESQELVVVSYLHSLVTQAERLDEDKVLGLLLDHHIVPLLLQHFEIYRTKVGDEGVEMYVWLLSHLVDTEYFQSHRNEFFSDKEDKKRLGLFESAAKAIKATETDTDRRRKIRALCDLIIRYK